jgi:hypothetical protein
MNLRTWVVFGVAVVVAVGGAALLVFDPTTERAAMHGDFERPFQPRLEVRGSDIDARMAGILSVQALPPVQLPKP